MDNKLQVGHAFMFKEGERAFMIQIENAKTNGQNVYMVETTISKNSENEDGMYHIFINSDETLTYLHKLTAYDINADIAMNVESLMNHYQLIVEYLLQFSDKSVFH